MGARARTILTAGYKRLLVIKLGPASKFNYDRNLAVKHADGVARRILGKKWERVWATNDEAAYSLKTNDKRRGGWA